MFIDDKWASPLTNSSNLIRRSKITETDHNKPDLLISIQISAVIPKREELFNFTAQQGQIVLKKTFIVVQGLSELVLNR